MENKVNYTYKETIPSQWGMQHVLRSDGVMIPFDQANADYQTYLVWLEQGNKPLPADKE